MKYTLVIFLVAKAALLFGQNNIITCDSIKLKDGQFIKGQIVNKTRSKITYIMCCENCAVPREIKLKNIDTIFFAEPEPKENEINSMGSIAELEPKENEINSMGSIAELEPKENDVNHRDSIPFLQFQQKGFSYTRRIKENKIILINTLDSNNYKGTLNIINKDSIRIGSDTIAISNILVIKKPVLAAKIIGNTIGIALVAVGLSLKSIGVGSEAFVADALALPFFSMNFIRKRYDVQKKWELEIKFQKIE